MARGAYLEEAASRFRMYRRLAEGPLDQVSEEDWFRELGPGENSIATLVGQIVFLARHFAGERWRSLSIPRGKSKEFEVSRSGETYDPGATTA